MPSAKNRRRTIGLTGGIGSGKSTVLAMFRKKGAFVSDADAIVRNLLERDRAVLNAIRRKFGRNVFSGDGRLDRKKLANVVFRAPRERKLLENILHPRVRKTIAVALKKAKNRTAVVDVPLLYESGWQKRFDRVIVVTASLKTRLKRLKKRGIAAADAKRRMKAQLGLRAKARKADYVVNNDGSLRKTKRQVDAIWARLQ